MNQEFLGFPYVNLGLENTNISFGNLQVLDIRKGIEFLSQIPIL